MLVVVLFAVMYNHRLLCSSSHVISYHAYIYDSHKPTYINFFNIVAMAHSVIDSMVRSQTY